MNKFAEVLLSAILVLGLAALVPMPVGAQAFFEVECDLDCDADDEDNDTVAAQATISYTKGKFKVFTDNSLDCDGDSVSRDFVVPITANGFSASVQAFDNDFFNENDCKHTEKSIDSFTPDDVEFQCGVGEDEEVVVECEVLNDDNDE